MAPPGLPAAAQRSASACLEDAHTKQSFSLDGSLLQVSKHFKIEVLLIEDAKGAVFR